MKLQLVVAVLLVGFMFTLSLAMAGEEGDARAVLQAIRMLLVSESHGHGELQQAENVTSAPSNQLLSMSFGGEFVMEGSKITSILQI